MYKQSYIEWDENPAKAIKGMPWKSSYFSFSKMIRHSCGTIMKASTRSEIRIIFDIEYDDASKRSDVIQVDLKGPQYYCAQCGKYVSTTSHCLDSDIPPRSRFSTSWANEMMRRIITTDLSLKTISQSSGLDQSVISKELTKRTKLFTQTRITYKPCETLLVFPVWAEKKRRCVICGTMKDKVFLFDVLPTYPESDLKNLLAPVQTDQLNTVVLDYNEELYTICRDLFPNAEITFLKRYNAHSIAWAKGPFTQGTYERLSRFIGEYSRRYQFAKMRYLLLSCPNAVYGLTSLQHSAKHMANYTSMNSAAAENLRYAFAMAITGCPISLLYNYAIPLDWLGETDYGMSYERDLPAPYYYDEQPYYYLTDNRNDLK